MLKTACCRRGCWVNDKADAKVLQEDRERLWAEDGVAGRARWLSRHINETCKGNYYVQPWTDDQHYAVCQLFFARVFGVSHVFVKNLSNASRKVPQPPGQVGHAHITSMYMWLVLIQRVDSWRPLPNTGSRPAVCRCGHHQQQRRL